MGLRGWGEENTAYNKFPLVLIIACTMSPRMLPRNSKFETRCYSIAGISKRNYESVILFQIIAYSQPAEVPHITQG